MRVCPNSALSLNQDLQGLKPAFICGPYGTTEVVPGYKTLKNSEP